MHPLKRIIGTLYFIYALSLFAVTMMVVIVPIWVTSLMDEPRRSHWMHPIFRLWMAVYMPLVGCPVYRRGKGNFEKGKNYVVVCNHNSFADVPVSSPWIPGPNKTLAKIEMARIPLFGVIYKAGSVLVDRKSDSSRRESFHNMNLMLEKGLHLCLYPEGTRNKGEEPMQKFYDGAFTTAIKAQKPIILGIIFNTRKIFPGKPKAWAWPNKIHFHFLPAIETQGLELKDVGVLKERVRNEMLAYFEANKEGLR